MKKLGWILVLALGLMWAYFDLIKAKTIPITERILTQGDRLTPPANPQHQPIEAGYVPGKSPDAQKAEDHIKLSLIQLPDEGPITIISKRILIPPREDGTWTEEWVAEKGKTQIPIKIEFGVGSL